ncbi:MAG: hypothetical protein WEA56_12130 [Balneolaceae bacterium]
MKTNLLIAIYGVSFLLLVLSLITFFEEDRIHQLEYIIAEEKIDAEVFESLKNTVLKDSNKELSVIYFVRPQICAPCMAEISEFSYLTNEYFGEENGHQIIVVNTEFEEESEQLQKALNLGLNYEYKPEEIVYRFLSSYELRELVGQMIIIDNQKQTVKARVILETSMPTETQAKQNFLAQIM